MSLANTEASHRSLSPLRTPVPHLSCLRAALSLFTPPPCLPSLNSSHLKAFPVLCPTVAISLPDLTAQVHAPWCFLANPSYSCLSPGGTAFDIGAAALLYPCTACILWEQLLPHQVTAAAGICLYPSPFCLYPCTISTHVFPAAVVALILAGISKSHREVAFVKIVLDAFQRKYSGKRGEKKALRGGALAPLPTMEIFWDDLWGLIRFLYEKD